MAASVTVLTGPEVPGNRKMVTGTVAFDSSYPTGGEAVALADLGLSRLDWLTAISTDGMHTVWDGSSTDPKIQLFYADYDAAANGALIEVPNGSNTTGRVARFIAFGA